MFEILFQCISSTKIKMYSIQRWEGKTNPCVSIRSRCDSTQQCFCNLPMNLSSRKSPAISGFGESHQTLNQRGKIEEEFFSAICQLGVNVYNETTSITFTRSATRPYWCTGNSELSSATGYPLLNARTTSYQLVLLLRRLWSHWGSRAS